MHDKTLQEILEQTRSLVQEVAVDDACRVFKAGEKTVFVDMTKTFGNDSTLFQSKLLS
jgi:hypothetical protein